MLRFFGTFLVSFFSVAFCFEFYNISYSPYGISTKPDGSQPVLETMVRDFEIMSLNFESLLFYGLDEYPYYVVDSLAESYGMSYWAGLYCGAYTDEGSRLGQARVYLDRSDSLGHVGFLGLIYGYNTGNLGSILGEMGELSSEYPDIPLTHLEYVDVVKRERWFYSDSLIDIVPVCVFPDQDIRWEDLSCDAIVSYVRDQYEDVCDLYPDKRVVLFEVGISTYGSLSEDDQADFLSSLVSWVEGDSIDAYLFEFRDQYWKRGIDKGYGLFDGDMGAKRFALDNLDFPYERKSVSFGDSVFACFYSDIFETTSREGDVIWSSNSKYIEQASGYSDYLILGGLYPSGELDLCSSFVSADIPFGMLITKDTLNERFYYRYAEDAGFVLLNYSSFWRKDFLKILQEIRDIAPLVPIGLLSTSTTDELNHMLKFSPYFDFFVTRHSVSDIGLVSELIDSVIAEDSIPIIPSYYGDLSLLLESGGPFIYTGPMSTFLAEMEVVSVVSVLSDRVIPATPTVLRVNQPRPEYFSLLGRKVPFSSSHSSSILIRLNQSNVKSARRVLHTR